MKLLEGVVVANVTPFNQDGQVDYEVLKRYTHFLSDRQVNGMFVCGTTAEAQILSTEERKKILETVVNANDGNMIITAQCGTNNLAETWDLIDHARANGADGAAVVTPYYYLYNQEELSDYYRILAREFADFPLYLYNIPQLTNNDLAVSTVSCLSHQFPNLAGIKDSSGRFATITGFILESRPDFRVFVGYDRAFLSSVMLGGKGIVTGPGGVFPEIFVDVWQTYLKQDYQRAHDLQRSLINISMALGEGADFAIVKAALSLRGFGNSRMRTPFHDVPDLEIKALRERLRQVLAKTNYPIPEFEP